MSVTVKVQFKDKLFKLSQGINNIQQVDEEMKRRYSSKLPPLEYSFEGSIVEDLNVLLKAQSKEGKTSIKIVAHPLDDFSRLCENSIISIVSNEKESGPEVRKVEEEVIILKENLVKVQKKLIQLPVIQYHMPKEFYTCYNCQGTGVYYSSDVQNLCQICQGRGELNNDHKYIQHIKKLFEVHGKQSINQHEIKVEEMKKEFSRIFKAVNKDFDVRINEINKLERMEIGQEFTYQFEIQNNGKDLPQHLEIVDCRTRESIPVKPIKSGEKLVITLGPFKCEHDGFLENAFYLCERKEDGWERLAYKFGFRIRGFKNVEVKKLEPTCRDLIRNLKVLSGSRKSEDYIGMKLKAMDIDLNNIQMEDQILIQIIRNIQ